MEELAGGSVSVLLAAWQISLSCSPPVNPLAGDWYSVAICSDGSYGIEKGLMASMPIRTLSDGTWEVVQGLTIDAFSQEKIDATINELKEEREAVKGLIPQD